MTKALLVALLVLFLTALARADVLMHKDGRRIEGTITSEKDGKIKIRTEFGELEFARADIVSVERGKTRWQEFEEREKACKSAEDFFQLGEWARARKMTKETKRCMQKAIDLDPKHAGAHRFFGHVEHQGEWMTPAERDKRVAAAEIAAKKASGLVEHQGRWITPEEKAHLDKNEVLVDGKWIPFADAQRKKGLAEFEGRWIPEAEALARENAAAVEKLIGVPFEKLLTADAFLCGAQPPEELALIGELLKAGRAWFDAAFQSPPGLDLYGGRLAEFYMFGSDGGYEDACPHLTKRARMVSRDWAEAVKSTQGFVYWDPCPTSAVRASKRPAEQIRGHDLHHLGHLLVNRLGYDRRQLPAWYEEGVAAIVEWKGHGKNAVFCEAPRPASKSAGPSTGQTPRDAALVSTRAWIEIADASVHDGQWRTALAAKLNEIPPLEVLAELEFHEMQPAFIAASMGIVAWLESLGPGTLRKFHDVLRLRAPEPPVRIQTARAERDAMYEEAFKAAAGMGAKDADRAWRQWVAKP